VKGEGFDKFEELRECAVVVLMLDLLGRYCLYGVNIVRKKKPWIKNEEMELAYLLLILTSAPLWRSRFRMGSLFGTLAAIMRGVQPLSSYSK
jgi:hypothetical protein